MKRALLVLVALVLVYALALADDGKMTSVPRKFTAVLAPQAIDTLEFDTRACDRLGYYMTFTGDSLKVWLDHGYIDHWTVWDSITFADTSAATQQWSEGQFAHAAVADSDTTAYFSGFMYQKVRARIQNLDAVAADSASAWPDTVTAGIFYLKCGD